MSSYEEDLSHSTSDGFSAHRSQFSGPRQTDMMATAPTDHLAVTKVVQPSSPMNSTHAIELFHHYTDGATNDKGKQMQSTTALAGSGKKGGGGSPGVPSKGITMKRKNIRLGGADDKYGHWWTELDGAESYGWWPKYPVGFKSTMLGTDGELNGVTSFGGTATRDPHHGDGADEVFQPLIVDPTKSEDTAKAEIRSFAHSYTGEWRWTFGAGQNCHTFQTSMMSQVGLKEP